MEVEQEQINVELTREVAIQRVIQRSLNVNGILKGVSETLKALENNKVKLVFLADDCDDENYKNVVTLLCQEKRVPVIAVDTWENLKDYCRLGLNSNEIRKIAEDKGKDPKIKPRCSSASILDFGDEDVEALDLLLGRKSGEKKDVVENVSNVENVEENNESSGKDSKTLKFKGRKK